MTTVTLAEILEYYDGIQVFEAEDPAGNRYIAVLTDTDGGCDRYATVDVSPERLTRFKEGNVCLRTLMLEAPGGEWFAATPTGGAEDPITLKLQHGTLTGTDHLPDEGYFLR